jgi:isochorismate pyruvate lyase
MPDVRREIDRVDLALVALLAERQSYIARAAEIKTARSAVHDQARINAVIGKVLVAAKAAGLSADIAEPVWRILVERCIAHEFALFDAKAQAAR